MKIDFRLDKIEFENYKNYSNKQVLDLTTERRFQEKTTERKEWLVTKKSKYKKITGIWGRNASGKSSIIEVVELWKTILVMMNFSYEEVAKSGIPEKIFSSHLYLIDKYKRKYNSEKFADYSQFNDKNKPISISLFFSIKDLSFKHTIEQQYNTGKFAHVPPNKIVNSERLSFLKADGTYEDVWVSGKNGYRLYDLVRVFSYLNNKDKFQSGEQLAYENFIKDKIDANYLAFTPKQQNNFIDTWTILMSFLDSFNIMDQTYDPSEEKIMKRTLDFSFEGLDSINFHLTSIYQYTQKTPEEIKKILLSFVNCCDQNVKEVLVNFVESEGNRFQANFIGIVTRNGITNFPEELSIGTITFIDIMLKILSAEIFAKNSIKYFFIDELGLNWHTNLTKKFLDKISDGSFGENVFVVFTSHDANIGDFLPTDSIYIINNENNLKRVSNLENKDNSAKRKNEKFSYNYLNYIFDYYSTAPDLDNFDDLDEIFNEIRK